MIQFIEQNFFILKAIEPVLFYSIVFIYAAGAATFLNVLLHRMPIINSNAFIEGAKLFLESRSIEHDMLKVENSEYNTLMGRSFCPSCKSQIPMWFNIPIISWVLLRGKSSCCREKISPRYVIVEALYPTFACLVFYIADSFLVGLSLSFFIYIAIAISDIDIKSSQIPDEYSYILIWSGLLLNTFNTFTSIEESVISGILFYLTPYFVVSIFRARFNSIGMGNGDFKLIAGIAIWFGGLFTLKLILVSCFVFVVFAIFGYKKEKKNQQLIPFSPFILFPVVFLFVSGV